MVALRLAPFGFILEDFLTECAVRRVMSIQKTLLRASYGRFDVLPRVLVCFMGNAVHFILYILHWFIEYSGTQRKGLIQYLAERAITLQYFS